MTIIYNKRTGSIKNIFSGNDQTLDIIFGSESEDYRIIFDELIVDDNWNVIDSSRMFKVNTDTKEIELMAM